MLKVLTSQKYRMSLDKEGNTSSNVISESSVSALRVSYEFLNFSLFISHDYITVSLPHYYIGLKETDQIGKLLL